MNNVLLVGCGHMGYALLNAWLNLKNFSFTVVDPLNYKNLKKNLQSKKVYFYSKAPSKDQMKNFDIIIFAIKPQVAAKVINEYKDFNLKKNNAICSIVAGKKINFFKQKIKNSNQIVRIMPNMPALINKGVSCLTGNKELNSKNKKIINSLFSKVGKTIWVKNENYIDKATSLSGSGPGYFFTLINSFEKVSKKMGFSDEVSRELIISTLVGSAELMKKTKKGPEFLANLIAVKGGTTEAGIKVLNKNKIDKIISDTVIAAYKKALILGKNK